MTHQRRIPEFLSPPAEGVRIGSSEESSASLSQAWRTQEPSDSCSSSIANLLNIPTPGICSWNVTSFCHYTKSQNKPDLHKRLSQMQTLINLARKYPILCIQESKLSAAEAVALADKLPSHTFFYSNNPANTGKKVNKFKAGVLTLVQQSYTDRFSIVHEQPLPGYIQHLRFTDSSNEWPDFDLVNLYLEKGGLTPSFILSPIYRTLFQDIAFF